MKSIGPILGGLLLIIAFQNCGSDSAPQPAASLSGNPIVGSNGNNSGNGVGGTPGPGPVFDGASLSCMATNITICTGYRGMNDEYKSNYRATCPQRPGTIVEGACPAQGAVAKCVTITSPDNLERTDVLYGSGHPAYVANHASLALASFQATCSGNNGVLAMF